MTKLQFRVLYREFLFRMMDLELLSAHAQGDMTRLLGQFASLLITTSIALTVPALGAGGPQMGVLERWTIAVSMEHFLIATTMLVVGLFAVLSWDSTFPDRRDVLVLTPLPIRARTLFCAKVAGVAHAMGLTVTLLHSLAGLIWPLALQLPGRGLLGIVRLYAAYWTTMAAAGAFMFCCVLGVQGLAAQILPRRWYLRASSWLQMGMFCLLLTVYCLQPMAPSLWTLAGAQTWSGWSPSYWFLGVFQQIAGWVPLPALAHRAWVGLGIAIGGTAIAYVLSYLRTLRQIVEEPDIVPGARRILPLPPFGDALRTALVHFSIRTFLRSRQHRMIFAFYLGIGFGVTILLLKSPATQEGLTAIADPWHTVNLPMLSSAILMMCASVLGARVVFALPLDIRANWVFRITPLHGGADCLSACRRAVLLLAVAPVWTLSAAAFLWLWPWRAAAGFLLVFGLLGLVAAELCVYGGHKIPFTCSYLPGRSRVHVMLWICLIVLVQALNRGAEMIEKAIASPGAYVALVGVLAVAAGLARWRTEVAGRWDEGQVRFEAEDPEALLTLGLSGGGAGA